MLRSTIGRRARPYFAKAERLFNERGDRRDTLYANISCVEADVEKGSYTQAVRFLSAQLQNPIVQNDARLKLRCLTVKGIVDLNTNTIDAERDWGEALNVAKALHDTTWQNRVPGRLAICATFRKAETPEGLRWMFQDVHAGGPAASAGITPLDLLLAINGQPITPPQQPMFPMGTTASVTIRKRGQSEAKVQIVIPKPRTRRQPYAEPVAVSSKKLNGGIGYLKATIFPGLLGIDVARSLDKTFASLSDCERLILDLRGNLGGGLGLIRLMSYLTPDRIPIGYSVTRKRAERGFKKESLPKFGHLPSSKLRIPLLALRFAGRDQSVVLMTEGLGPKKFHGRIALLVNEHTVSAGEMITAFAAENKLATIVGTETAGRLLGGTGFKVGHGYLVILPKAAFYKWQGKSYEGHGITPDVSIPWSAEAAREGKDNQLEKAVEVAKAI